MGWVLSIRMRERGEKRSRTDAGFIRSEKDTLFSSKL